MKPLMVAPGLSGGRRRRGRRIPLQPFLDYIMVKLLRPEQTGAGLADNNLLLGRGAPRHPGGVELIALAHAAREHLLEWPAKRRGLPFVFGAKAELKANLRAGRQIQVIVKGSLGPSICVDHYVVPVNDRLIKRILDKGAEVLRAEDLFLVGLILSKKNRRQITIRSRFGEQVETSQGIMVRSQRDELRTARGEVGTQRGNKGLGPAFFICAIPTPGVAEPKGWQDMQGSGLGTTVRQGDPNQDVIRRSLGVFGKNI